MDNDFRNHILKEHNSFRNYIASGKEKRSGATSASNMMVLNYDFDLEFSATCTANKCKIEHDQCTRTRKFYYVGTNLHRGSLETSQKAAVNDWYSEILFMRPELFDRYLIILAARNFTQVVWARTTHIGCGRAHSEGSYYLACNYGPSGNKLYGSVYKKEKLYAGQSKNEQDTFLMGCIERFDVKRHRPTVDHSKQINASFKYYVIVSGNRSEVCRKAFISLYAISHKIVIRLTNLLAKGMSPLDMRGKHLNCVNTIPTTITTKIHEHIDSYPKYLTHYTKQPITYLDAKLDVLKMYDMFLQKHPDLGTKVKYEFFLKYFKENFGYRFGKPQVDVCSTCEDLQTKLKSTTLNDNAKRTAAAELIVHKRRAKKILH
ncbi:unnamed protein product [Diabrotica balteata]|uniref:SCP domain-containing protein n=1 Tax=Diabrotica balteata TaxID=107213 RepID=A0A9N9SVP4_DIABA|nr:unnamed protein product [Diabrotica balteata]